MAVRHESRHAAELSAQERSATAASGVLQAIGHYRLATSRSDVVYRTTSKQPIDRAVLGQLAVVFDTHGEALTDLDLRFMLRQALELARLYVDRRNDDSFEWVELEDIQGRALDYLTYALGRHIRRQPVSAWTPLPLHDFQQLMAWSPADQAPDTALPH